MNKISSLSLNSVPRAENPEDPKSLNLVFRSPRPRSNKNDRRLVLKVMSESESRRVTLRKIFLNFLWDRLSDLEFEAMLLLALEVKDDLVLEAFKAFRDQVPLTLLRSRVNAYCILKNLKPFSRREYLSTKCFRFLVLDEDTFDQQPRIKSYSGWRRHQNDQGSLRPGVHPYEYSEPIEPEDILDENNSIREYLSVGRQSPPENESTLMMAIRIAETEKFRSLTIMEMSHET